jgi:hypothetical protein
VPDPETLASGEQWRPVPECRLLGVPAGYQASDDCRVRSVPRTLADGRAAGGRVLKQQRDGDGYLTVRLGGRRTGVHVAVALAFHGKPEVMHLNDVRDDNRPGNLAWGSHRVNMSQVTREAGKASRNGGSLPSTVETPGTGDPC